MDRRINVLHLLGTAQADGSGIAKIVAALAQSMDPQRFKLQAWFLKSDGPLIAELCAAGVDARWVGWKNGMRDPLGALRFWKRFRSERFDLVHQHWGARSIRQLIRFGSNAKIIVHSHGQILEQRKGKRDPVAVRGADAIIAVSQSIAHQLQPQQAHVVYSGIAPSEHPERSKAKHESTVVIGTACRLIEAKGVRDLIIAFAALHKEQPMIRLEIAGVGPEEETFSKEAVDQGVGKAVRFLGWQNDLRATLRTWDIFVLSSYDEGLPIAILEAMAEGLPVIATKVGGIPELVEHAGTGYLIEPGDTNNLRLALRKLIMSSQLRWQLGEAGRRNARNRFSIERMVADVTSIYDALARSERENKRAI